MDMSKVIFLIDFNRYIGGLLTFMSFFVIFIATVQTINGHQPEKFLERSLSFALGARKMSL